MTKTDLAQKIAEDTNISKKDATFAVNSFMDNVAKELKKKDGKVTLVGFGTFSKVKRKAREGRNPQTGAPLVISARNAIKFKPGKDLIENVNIG